MALVATMDMKGDTQDLLGKYDILSQHLMSNSPPPQGLIAHFCMKTADGIRISDVWDGEEHARAAYGNPLMLEGFTNTQMPAWTPQLLPVHNHFIVSEMKAAI